MDKQFIKIDKTISSKLRQLSKRCKALNDKGDSQLKYLVSNSDLNKIAEELSKDFNITQIEIIGQKKITLTISPHNVNVIVFGVNDKSFGSALLDHIGSEFFIIGLKAYARKLGYLLNVSGLFLDNVWVAGETENSIFNKLSLNFIPPEKRVTVNTISDFYKLKESYKMTKSESLIVLSEISHYLQEIRLGL